MSTPETKTHLSTPADIAEPPTRPKPQVQDHELIRKIGSGAYGEVWLAKNVVGTHRAVKVVYRNSFKDAGPYEREYRGIQKFEPISRSNDGFVDILQIGRNDEQGLFYYVMELADDANAPVAAEVTRLTSDQSLLTSAATNRSYAQKTLQSEIRQHGRLPFEDCLRFALSLNLALGQLHRHGLIHRDIKPSNIIFIRGIPKLADIGLVTEVEEARTFVGTEGFIPPEGPNSARADIYSLGKVLYEMSMGKDRMEFPEPFTALGQATESHDLEELNAVIVKACATNPRDRYQSAEEMHVDLALLQSGKSVKSKRMLERRLAFARKASALVGAVAAVAVMAFLYQQFQTREARRLAQENRELASRESTERQRAESLLNTLQLKQAENIFENDDANKGVAYLAHLLRKNPTNEIVGSRLMSALTDRSFALPVRIFKSDLFVFGAEFHPNGRQFVTWGEAVDETKKVSYNRSAQLWDVASGQIVGQPMLHSNRVLRARFSEDGCLLVTMTIDGAARVWDGATGEPISAPLQHPRRASGGARSTPYELAAFSSNGELLMTGVRNEARIWIVATGQLLTPALDHGSGISNVEFSPDGRVATSGRNITKLWSGRSGALQHTLDVGDGIDTLARFSPDGRRIVVVGGFHGAVWDTETGQQIFQFRHGTVIGSVHFSPDGSRIVTADNNRIVRLWDAESGPSQLPPLMHGAAVRDAQFDPTGERVLTWESRRVRVWDSRTGQPVTEWMLHSGSIWSARFSWEGDSVLTAADKTLILWDVRPGRAVNMALRHDTLVPVARFSRDGTRVVSVEGPVYKGLQDRDSFDAAVWDARTGELAAPRMTHSDQIRFAEFSPDGRRIVTASGDGEGRVWDARTGAPISDVMKHKDTVQSARFSPDGRKVVTACMDGTVQIWDAETGRPLGEPLKRSDPLVCAEFSPDGLSVLTATRAGARIFDAKAEQTREKAYFDANVLTACFSPDGRRIATGNGSGSGRIWSVEPKGQIGEVLRHKAPIRSIRFSPDGRYVVTASDDQTARVWDALTGKPASEPLTHRGVVLSAEFSPDSRRVVTASIDYTARVWDVVTGRPLTEPLRESHWVAGAEFSPDGTTVLTASAASVARIWELPPAGASFPEWLPDLAEAIAGERWTDHEASELVSPAKYLVRRAEVLQTAETETNDQSRWLKWLMADRSTRTVSSRSSMSVSRYVAGLTEMGKHAHLREALHLIPNDPVTTARLARQSVKPGSSPEAEFLLKRTAKLNPEKGEAWRIIAEVAERIGHRQELLRAMDHLLMRTDELAFGALRRETFRNIAGAKLSALTNHSRFPNDPDAVGLVYEFKTLSDQDDNYGVRLTGYIVPPKSGEYRFYLASNEEGALFLSADESPEHKRQIAHEPVKSGSRVWTGGPNRPENENISQPIHLHAGRRYYVEALMKEREGADNLAVAWQMPGEPPPENLSPPIPGTYLAVPTEWLKAMPASPLSESNDINQSRASAR